MAAPLVNFFQALPKTTPSQPAALDSSAPSNPAAGKKFARMVDDASNSRASHDAPRRDANRATDSTHNTERSRRAASTNDNAHHACDETVTPEDAQELLNNFDTLSEGLTEAGLDSGAQEQLKQRLQAIVDSDTPQTIGDLIGNLMADDGGVLTPPTINWPTLPTTETTPPTINWPTLPTTETTPPTINWPTLPTTSQGLSPMAGKLAAFLNKALAKCQKQEAQTQDPNATASDPTLNPALFVLQAGMFRPDASAPATDAPAEEGEKTAGQIVAITPLAQTLIIPQDRLTATSNEPDTVVAINDKSKKPDIDALIPPLTEPEDESALPAITLPKAAPVPPKRNEGNNDFQRTLNIETESPIVLSKPQPVETLFAPLEPVKPAAIKTTATDTLDNAIAPVGATGAPLNTQAVTPITNVTGQNHAPIREQVSVAITQASHSGIDHMTIQLAPEGMGRVEVKLHTGADGQTHIAFTVDKPETFDSLSRDARSLERSLQESGIKADTSSMQFNLRQQPQPQPELGGDGNGKQQPGPQSSLGSEPGANATASAVPITKTYRVNVHDGLDIHA